MPVVPKISPDDFAQKIKAKYPDYKDVDNTELINKIIQKYPEYKEQINFSEKKNSDLSVDGKGNLQNSVPGTSPSESTANKVPDFGMKSFADLQKGQQSQSDNTASTNVGQFESSVDETQHHAERAAAREAQRVKIEKATPIALENAAKKSLKLKGIDPSNTAQLGQEKENFALQLYQGDAQVGFDKDGTPGLIQNTGFLDNFHDHMMSAIQANHDAREFHKMTVPERVAFANKKQVETPSPYIGSKPTELGSVGATVGGAVPTLGLYGAGALAGSVLEMAAPETGGLSNLAMKPVMSFVMNANAGADQKGMQGVLQRYQEIKNKYPAMDDNEAMTHAQNGEDVDRLAGIAESALFSKVGGELKLGKSVTGNLLKGVIKSGIDVGSKTAIAEGLKDIGHNIEGVTDKSVSDITKDMATTFGENAPLGAALHGFMGVISGIARVPAMIKSALKYDVVTKMNADQIGGLLEENVRSGAITDEQATKAVDELKQFDNTLRKVPASLSDEAKASAAGLIIKRDNLIKNSEGLDTTAQDLIKQQTDNIDSQLKDIYRTGKPLEHEINPATGETFKQPVFDDVAKKNVEDLADKISKGKRIEDPQDLKTETNFPKELEKQLNRIAKEEKSANKDKEKPNTELSDNINTYLEKNATQKAAPETTLSANTEEAGITDKGTGEVGKTAEEIKTEKPVITSYTDEEIKQISREKILSPDSMDRKVEFKSLDPETNEISTKKVKSIEARDELRKRLKGIDNIIKCL